MLLGRDGFGKKTCLPSDSIYPKDFKKVRYIRVRNFDGHIIPQNPRAIKQSWLNVKNTTVLGIVQYFAHFAH